MRRAAVAVMVAVVAFLALTGCEPKMTITAHGGQDFPSMCDEMPITGVVTPATATAKVVMQWTSGGKWVDAKGNVTADGPDPTTPHTLTANVSKVNGHYTLNYVPNWMGTKHLRMRSAGSGGTSPGFYVTIDAWDGYC